VHLNGNRSTNGGVLDAGSGTALEPVLGGPAVNEQLRAHDQAEVEELSHRLLALLGDAGPSRTWLAMCADGVVRVARRLPEGPDQLRDVLANRLVQVLGFRSPGLLATTQLWAERETWVVREFGDGVPLRQMLRVAKLTRHQVATITHDILAPLVALHGAGIVHGGVHPGNVIVGMDGQASLCDASQRVTGSPEPSMHQDLEDVSKLMRAALATAPSPARGPRPNHVATAALLPGLETILRSNGAGRPTGQASTGAAAMLLALDDLAGEVHLAGRRQLAALVDRLPGQRFR
jgi:hypothetical protein